MPKRVFISHRNVEPDSALGREIHDRLERLGHQAFLDASDLRLGDDWPAVIQRELEGADALVLLLSKSVAESPDMVARELSIVHRLRHRHQRPAILPILLGSDVFDQLPYDITGKIERVQYEMWGGAEDTERLLAILAKVLGDSAATTDVAPPTLAERQEIRDARSTAALALKAEVFLRAGRHTAAELAGDRLVGLAREKNNDRLRAKGLMLLGDVYRAQGHEERALVIWRRSRKIFERLKSARELAQVDQRLAGQSG